MLHSRRPPQRANIKVPQPEDVGRRLAVGCEGQWPPQRHVHIAAAPVAAWAYCRPLAALCANVRLRTEEPLKFGFVLAGRRLRLRICRRIRLLL